MRIRSSSKTFAERRELLLFDDAKPTDFQESDARSHDIAGTWESSRLESSRSCLATFSALNVAKWC